MRSTRVYTGRAQKGTRGEHEGTQEGQKRVHEGQKTVHARSTEGYI